MVITISTGMILVVAGAVITVTSLILQVVLHRVFKKREEQLVKDLGEL